jgi:hypothetical protein
MAKKRNRVRRNGRFCWCCGRMRPNERFSGKGHARHLCRECSKLGREELEYRQRVRDIDRLLTWDGMVRRKNRKAFARFLRDANPRVREYAERVKAHNEERRAERRAERLTWAAEEAMLAEQETGANHQARRSP